jgi:hypothetical protein
MVDTTDPTVNLSMLPDGAAAANPVLNIAGSASDAGSGMKSISVNGVDVPAAGEFSLAFKLSEGANTVTVTASDNLGNQMSETRVITYDRTAPQLNVASPSDNSKTNSSYVAVNGIADANAMVNVKVNGGYDQVAVRNGADYTAAVLVVPGINTVEITVIDQAGRTAAEKRTVTVVGAAKPSIAITEPIRDIKTYQNSTVIKGTVANAVGDVTVTVKSCSDTFNPLVANGLFEQQVNFTDEGTYRVMVSATDVYGNETEVQRNIIYEKLGLALSADKPSPQTQGYPVTFTASASGGSGSYEYQFILYNGQAWGEAQAYSSANTWTWDTTTIAPGTYNIRANVRNAGEDSPYDSFTAMDYSVLVNTIPPTLTVPADIVKEAAGPITPVDLGKATVDGICKPITVTNDASSLDLPLGTTLVTWTAKDANGLTTTNIQNVTIVDTTPPLVTAPANMTVEATGQITKVDIRAATATDVVGVVSLSNDAPASFPLGATAVTWTARDAAGNFGTAIQIVVVMDTTPPVITAPQNRTFEAMSVNTPLTASDYDMATATDAVGVKDVTNNAPAAFPLGDTIIIWTATDTSGNISSSKQTITIMDTTSPTLTIPADIVTEATGPVTPGLYIS